MDGWIKLWRKTLNSRVFQNAKLFQLWMYCLMKANHKDNWVSITTGKGKTEVLVKEGSFIFGREKASKELKQKPTSTYKRLLKLKSVGNCDIQSNTHYSIVTILNWDKYQSIENEKEQEKCQPSDNQVTTKCQPSDTNKNDKNDKNDKKKEKHKKEKEVFEIFRKIYPGTKRGLSTEFDNFTKKHKDWKDVLPRLTDLLNKQIKAKEKLSSKGEFVPVWKNMQTYINQRCWEEEISIPDIKQDKRIQFDF